MFSGGNRGGHMNAGQPPLSLNVIALQTPPNCVGPSSPKKNRPRGPWGMGKTNADNFPFFFRGVGYFLTPPFDVVDPTFLGGNAWIGFGFGFDRCLASVLPRQHVCFFCFFCIRRAGKKKKKRFQKAPLSHYSSGRLPLL